MSIIKEYRTWASDIQIITLKKFISMLQVLETDQEKFVYNTFLAYKEIKEVPENETYTDTSYKRLIAIPNCQDPIKACLTALGHHSSHIHVLNNSPQVLLEDAVMKHIDQFGVSDYAVR